jgi:acyl-lipid omega-6 desaturase (Delta-12 desaturase)
MRTGKELIAASKAFAIENRLRSWMEVFVTILLIILFFAGAFIESIPLPVRILSGIACGLSYVRLFVIYHDYEHRAILQDSSPANWIMKLIGIYLLAPETIWKRSHEHHHNNNSKLTIAGIGSYPTITKKHFLKLSKNHQRLYLINRHPLTIIFGYFTLFIYWLNLKSFFQSPSRHVDSFAALLLHIGLSVFIGSYYGATTFFIAWFMPFLLAFGMGSYLFYCQHNFPGAQFKENHDWTYDNAALSSTSCMTMNPVMQWFTGNIGFHHVHHLNSRIPFYRLEETMHSMPELKNAATTSWHPMEVIRCFQLKLWDCEKRQMITMSQLGK